MLYTATPRRFEKIWAEGASGSYIRTVPFATSGDPNAASYQIGFPPPTFLDEGAGGVPPDGRDFNAAYHDMSAWVQWQAAGAPIFFDATFAAAVGGYPKYAILTSTTLGRQWQSQVDNNSVDPDAGPSANWVQLLGANDPANSESVTLPNGKILKDNAVSASYTDGNVYSIGFGVAFPTACRCVQVTAINSSGSTATDVWVQLVSYNASGFTFTPQWGGGGAGHTIQGITWSASGY